jgi:NTP pyrophosphatase (non-canonical NTP hydrolase)
MEDILGQYEEFVRRRRIANDTVEYLAIGFGGEAGEILNEIKKEMRDGVSHRTDILHEMGDALYYLTALASKYEYSLEDVITANHLKLNKRDEVREGR